MITEIWRKRKELSEHFNKDLENIRKNQSEFKNIMTEIKKNIYI